MVITRNHNILGILFYLAIHLGPGATNSVDSEKCYNSTRDFYPYMGSRTSYDIVRGDIQRIEDCSPLRIWMIARHGVRYSYKVSEQQIQNLTKIRDQIIANFENGRSLLCSDEITKLRSWKRNPMIREGATDTLTEAGEEQIRSLAKRLKDVFPEILESNDPKHYRFLTSSRSSATSSLLVFGQTLLDTNETIAYEIDQMKKPEDCHRWLKEYNHTHQMIQYKAFANGPVIAQTVLEISQRLGFNETIGLTNVNFMYEMCRYETALAAGNASAWCSVFSRNDLIVFEYLENLDYFYCCGPGNKLIKKSNCAVLQNVFEAFDPQENENRENKAKGIFTFGHSHHVQGVMSILKIFDDEKPFLASEFDPRKHRFYNTSFMDPFGANVVAVLYKCDNLPNQVQFYIDERPIEIPGCGKLYCDWEVLKRETLKPMFDQCNLNYCELPANETIITVRDIIKDPFDPLLNPVHL